jgi:SpoVK/Ycf46/Vps4 family AAA+-type ATPase
MSDDDSDDKNKKRNIDETINNFIKDLTEQDDNIKESEPKKKLKISIKEHKIICLNKLCDHKKHYASWYNKNKIGLEKVDDLNDLINLSTKYHCQMRRFYNGIDLKTLFGIKDHLVELNEMIGLSNIKEEVVNLVIYLLIMKNIGRGLNTDMLHSVITGSPGCGKTTLIDIMAKIYTKLGVLSKGHVIKVKRSDLIGKYLGHTAIQTQKKIDEAKGGILLIDEAYSLGNPEGRDSFSKECIDTLNQALSESKDDFICIIAGYKNSLDTSFFAYNDGLRRRFPFRFDIEKYKSEELTMILLKKVKEYLYWKIDFDDDSIKKLIEENFKHFENQGGDMETLFLNIKIVHNKRVFLIPVTEKENLIIGDIKDAIKKFIKLKCVNKEETNKHVEHMYL